MSMDPEAQPCQGLLSRPLPVSFGVGSPAGMTGALCNPTFQSSEPGEPRTKGVSHLPYFSSRASWRALTGLIWVTRHLQIIPVLRQARVFSLLTWSVPPELGVLEVEGR